jgi:hypothetical protein
MKKKNFLIIMLIFGLFLCVNSVQAVHYVKFTNSVDHREIRWNGGTAYRDQLNAAIATWNALGRINIAPDNIMTIEDLRILDVNRRDVDWSGIYFWSAVSADSVAFNRAFLVDAVNVHRQSIITHELGHALGLDHSIRGNVMASDPFNQVRLGPQDISDYRFLWGN